MPPEQIENLLAGLAVQLSGRLVGQEQRGPVGQRARDGHALHLAARELGGPVPAPLAEPHVVEQLAGARAPVGSATPASAIGSSTFSSAVSTGSRWKRWKTKPSRVRRSRVSSRSESRSSRRPSMLTAPDDGGSMPPRMWSSVDLPDPDGPAMATYSPASIVEVHAAERVHRLAVHRVVAPDVAADDEAHVASARECAAMGARAASHAG